LVPTPESLSPCFFQQMTVSIMTFPHLSPWGVSNGAFWTSCSVVFTASR
jgi:hypothetical protein